MVPSLNTEFISDVSYESYTHSLEVILDTIFSAPVSNCDSGQEVRCGIFH
jgi:hypothetical protein